MNLTTALKRRKGDGLDKENVETQQPSIEGDLEPAVGCFDLKMRHNMSESHHQSSASAALAKLLSLFRSKSDPTVKSDSNKSCSKSPSKSTSSSKHCASAAAPRRRFVRVVRDEKAQAPEVVDDNPHVICRYSQSFLEEHYRQSEEELSNRPLPYVTSGHTILKKSSTDPTPSCDQNSPTAGKHATFKELVEVIEFSGHDVVETGQTVSHEARLHDSSASSSPDEEREPGFFLRNETDNTDDQDADILAPASPLDDDDDDLPVPAVDLDRMDGVMRNIFSSVANVHHASPEPPKIRRVELSELITHHDSEEQLGC